MAEAYSSLRTPGAVTMLTDDLVEVARINAMTTLPLAEVRNHLSALVDEVARTHDTLIITRNGVPAAVVLSIADYESVMETLALVNDPDARARLAEAEESIAVGDVTTAEEMGDLMAARRRKSTTA
jgi:antitoxin YefM